MLHLLAILLLAQTASVVGTRVKGPSYDGLVISCGSWSESSQCWEPTPTQIATLESVIRRFTLSRHPRGLAGLLHPLNEYRRQYLGLKGATGTVIVVSGYHREQEVVRSGRWLKTVIMVSGGGGEFFHGRFLVAHGTFESLSINAPA
jgi:hypothetical protein